MIVYSGISSLISHHRTWCSFIDFVHMSSGCLWGNSMESLLPFLSLYPCLVSELSVHLLYLLLHYVVAVFIYSIILLSCPYCVTSLLNYDCNLCSIVYLWYLAVCQSDATSSPEMPNYSMDSADPPYQTGTTTISALNIMCNKHWFCPVIVSHKSTVLCSAFLLFEWKMKVNK